MALRNFSEGTFLGVYNLVPLYYFISFKLKKGKKLRFDNYKKQKMYTNINFNTLDLFGFTETAISVCPNDSKWY